MYFSVKINIFKKNIKAEFAIKFYNLSKCNLNDEI